ncbi:hypothetical protein ACJZ2D_012731 [Fusarium nematophilum]
METANFSSRRSAAGALPAFALPAPTTCVPSALPSHSPGPFHNFCDADLNTDNSQGSQDPHGIPHSYGSHVYGGSSHPAIQAQPSLGQHDFSRHGSSLYNQGPAMQQSNHLRSSQSPSTGGEGLLPPPYHQDHRPYSPYQLLPTMDGPPIMSNIHHPGGQLSIPRMAVPPYGHHHMVYRHGQPGPQSGRPFKCDQCMQSFSRQHDLKRHKRIHLAVKPFPCTYCSKSFSRKDALKRHELVKGCRKTSVKRGEDSELGKNDTDILTQDCKPALDMRAGNQLPQPTKSSFNNSPFPTTSRGDEPPYQGGIRLPTGLVKTEPLEDPIETFAKPALPDCSQQHRPPVLPKLSEDPEYRVSSQTPHSDGSSAVTERYIDERKSHIVNSIVFGVTQWLRSKFDSCRKNGGCNLTDASGTSEARLTAYPKSKPPDSIKPNNGKRKLTDSDDHDTDDDGDDGHGKDERSSHRPMQDDENPKYACPYFKYNPAKYKDWRICPGPGWTDVHRVKEHLYRRHRQPKYRCGRCWQHFKDEEGYLNHQRTPQPCPLREMEHVEGFDAAQERSLKSRKRANPELSETEKWKRVFQILFPHVLDDDIPSPCKSTQLEGEGKECNHRDSESDYLARCEEYMVREVPQRLRQALGRELDRDLNIVEESLRRKAGDWVKTLLEEAFRELRHNRRPDGPSQPLAVDDERPGPTEGSGLPLVPTPQPNSPETSVPHCEGESEAWPLSFDLDSFDPFTILGETELSFDNGGLLENLLRPEEGGDGESKKHSDSGYGSHSSIHCDK